MKIGSTTPGLPSENTMVFLIVIYIFFKNHQTSSVGR